MCVVPKVLGIRKGCAQSSICEQEKQSVNKSYGLVLSMLSFVFGLLADTAARADFAFTPAEAQVDGVLVEFPPWDCIYPEDRKAMIADMKQRIVEKGQLIQAEEDPNCPLYISVSGTINIFQRVGAMQPLLPADTQRVHTL